MAKEKKVPTEKDIDDLLPDKTGSETNIIDSSDQKGDLVDQKYEEGDLVSDSMVLGVYAEIMNNVRKDRKEIDEVLGKFADMVINEGDATTSSKEALVNLLKMKTDQSDKMTKIADLMTRVKLKEKDASRFVTKQDGTVINIGNTGTSKRALLEQINEAAEKARKNKNDS